MVDNGRIARLAEQLGERLQDASRAPEEIQRSVQSVLKGAFDRMELVSREDFDILMDVMQRTRSRVEALEKQVAALEAALDDESSASLTPSAKASESAGADLDSKRVDQGTETKNKSGKSRNNKTG